MVELPPGSEDQTVLALGVDVWSKFVVATPLRDKASDTVSRWFYRNIVAEFGCPLWVRSDRGNEFRGHFEELSKQFGITRFVTSPYSP